jgi:hypothetical protein
MGIIISRQPSLRCQAHYANDILINMYLHLWFAKEPSSPFLPYDDNSFTVETKLTEPFLKIQFN